MHKFFETRHIFGFGPALIVVAAQETKTKGTFRYEAFVGFPRTTHPARTAFDAKKFVVPADRVNILDPVEVTLDDALEEGQILAKILLAQYKEKAYAKSGDLVWLEDIELKPLENRAVLRAWMNGYYHRAFKDLVAHTKIQSLQEFFTELAKWPTSKHGDNIEF